MSDKNYMVTLHVNVPTKEEAVELAESLGTVFMGHVMDDRDCALHVTVYNDDDEVKFEAGVDSDGKVERS